MCANCGTVFAKPYTVSQAAWVERKYCKRSCQYEAMRGRANPKQATALRGRNQSSEHVAKRVEALRHKRAEGTYRQARPNLGLRREQTSRWKGDDIQYGAAHRRLYSLRGKPTECMHCGATEGRLEWALRHDAIVCKVQAAGHYAGRRYSPCPDDYIPLCGCCHRAYDRA